MTGTMRRVRRVRLFLPAIVANCLSAAALGQQAPAVGWSGWARCEITVQGTGYSDRQTHTWKISGGAPTVQGAFHIYQGTWEVVGGGSLTRTQGSQTLRGEWATNASGISAPTAVFVRASDNKMFIQARHAQLRQAAAVQGYQQLTVNGVPQNPVPIKGEAFEWGFPVIAVSAPVPPSTNATASGSSNSPVVGSVGMMQPGGSQVTAACTWQFGQGSAAPAPPSTLAAQAIPVPGAGGASTPAPGGTVAPDPAATPTPTPEPAAQPPVLVATPLDPSALPMPVLVPQPPNLTATPLDPGVLPQPALCQLRGPEPRSSAPASYTTPGTANLFWNAIPSATGFTVSRSDVGYVTATRLAGTETAFVHRAMLSHPATYVYTITAFYPNGCGSSIVSLPSQAPITANLAYQLVGNGRVRISWIWASNQPARQRLNDFTGVLVTGPGLPPAGREVRKAGGTEYTIIDAVPAGNQTWTVKAYWDTPGGRVMDTAGKAITVRVP